MKQICGPDTNARGWKARQVLAPPRRGEGTDTFSAGLLTQIGPPSERVVFRRPPARTRGFGSLNCRVVKHRVDQNLPGQIDKPRCPPAQGQCSGQPPASRNSDDHDPALIDAVSGRITESA